MAEIHILWLGFAVSLTLTGNNCDTFKLNMGLKGKSCYIGSIFVFAIS